jgi:hypothetical protein
MITDSGTADHHVVDFIVSEGQADLMEDVKDLFILHVFWVLPWLAAPWI